MALLEEHHRVKVLLYAVAALWDPLPCSSPSTPDCSGAPFGRGTFPGGQVRSLGDFGVLVYPPSGVARQSPCTLALLSIGDVARPLHLTIALPGPGRGRLKKKQPKKKKNIPEKKKLKTEKEKN